MRPSALMSRKSVLFASLSPYGNMNTCTIVNVICCDSRHGLRAHKIAGQPFQHKRFAYVLTSCDARMVHNGTVGLRQPAGSIKEMR